MTNFKGMKKAEIRRLQKEQAKADKKAEKERAKREAQDKRRSRSGSCSTCLTCNWAEADCAVTGPINVDERCGVPNEETGQPCARSLTCKTHTMGAKRAVPGRSRPYDELYLEWQRAHNPNFKEPTTKPPKAAGDGKKKGKKNWDEGVDDSVPEGEEGQRELEEFIRFTNWAGERYRGLYVRRDRVAVGGAGGGDGDGEGLTGAAAGEGEGEGNKSSTGAGGQGEGATGGKGKGRKDVNGSGVGQGPAPMLNSTRTMPYCPWRATGYEMGVVGDQMTKALAMRSVGVGGAAPGGGGARARSVVSGAGAGGGGGGTTLVIPALNGGSRANSADSSGMGMAMGIGMGLGIDGGLLPPMAAGGYMMSGGEGMMAQPSFGVAA